MTGLEKILSTIEQDSNDRCREITEQAQKHAQEIIDAARNHMSNDDKRLDSVLSQLDDLKVQLKDAQAEAEQAQKQAVELAKKDKKKGKPTAQALDETRGDNDEK